MHTLTKHLLFHQRLTHGHVHTPLDLPLHQVGVNGFANIMANPHLGHGDPAGVGIDRDLDHNRRVAICR